MTERTKEKLSRGLMATTGAIVVIAGSTQLSNPDKKIESYAVMGFGGLLTAWALGILDNIS